MVMTVSELRDALEGVDPDVPIEIEIETLSGHTPRAVELVAGLYRRRAGQVFIIEGRQPEPRVVRDIPQS